MSKMDEAKLPSLKDKIRDQADEVRKNEAKEVKEVDKTEIKKRRLNK